MSVLDIFSPIFHLTGLIKAGVIFFFLKKKKKKKHTPDIIILGPPVVVVKDGVLLDAACAQRRDAADVEAGVEAVALQAEVLGRQAVAHKVVVDVAHLGELAHGPADGLAGGRNVVVELQVARVAAASLCVGEEGEEGRQGEGALGGDHLGSGGGGGVFECLVLEDDFVVLTGGYKGKYRVSRYVYVYKIGVI